MSAVLGLPTNFKPDARIVIEYDAKLNAAKIEVFHPVTGQPLQVSPFLVLSALITSMQGNLNAMANMTVQNMAKQQHAFVALDGETKCRVPRCGKLLDDPIHVVEVQP